MRRIQKNQKKSKELRKCFIFIKSFLLFYYENLRSLYNFYILRKFSLKTMSFFPMNKRKSIFEEILTNNCSILNVEQLLSEENLFDEINFHMNSASNL